MTKDIEQLSTELEQCKEVTSIEKTPRGLEIDTEIINPRWGLPNGVYECIKHSDFNLVDFSDMREHIVTIYIE